MDDGAEAGSRDGALVLARARCHDAGVEAVEMGQATVITRAERPLDASLNRAYDVDLREPGVAARIVAHMRARGLRPLMEVREGTEGDTAELAALGLAPLWEVVTLRLDLEAPLPAAPASDARVRAARETEAEAFGALAVRAFGLPPPGLATTVDPDAAHTWTTLCRLGRARCFIAERRGVPCAIGVSVRAGDAAFVDGAATLAEHRGRGCQSALLSHRFHEAKGGGARVAFTRARAGSPSQQNLERAGMAVYRRTQVWGAPLDA
jgi:GNAT superfamily N-acetyltransferase